MNAVWPSKLEVNLVLKKVFLEGDLLNVNLNVLYHT